jgi:hypothetical protein
VAVVVAAVAIAIGATGGERSQRIFDTPLADGAGGGRRW